jgi:hypothetical protein
MGVGEGRTLSLSSCRTDQFKAHQAISKHEARCGGVFLRHSKGVYDG